MRGTNVSKRAAAADLAPTGAQRSQMIGSVTAVYVQEPHHLCGVQLAARELCRSIDFSESAVFQAVIAVTELVHRLFVESGRMGRVELALVRTKGGRGLHVRAESDDGLDPPTSGELTFPPGYGSPISS